MFKFIINLDKVSCDRMYEENSILIKKLKQNKTKKKQKLNQNKIGEN